METTTILALDPSTDRTGVAVVEFFGDPKDISSFTSVCLWETEIAARSDDDSLQSRIERIAYTRRELEKVRHEFSVGAPYIVAYEYHLMRGGPASEALSMAAGAYLTVFEGREIISITPAEAKAAWEGTRYKRDEAKRAAVQWANREFSLRLAYSQDAIADALAVAVAAHKKRFRSATPIVVQRPLFGPGSKGGKARV